ncbi:MAG TPA: hypothetical protein PKE47_13245 [Verrucomicrobiota bacterium]|nr:hypothetical protein [Verrucomicrobiota bacterium]
MNNPSHPLSLAAALAAFSAAHASAAAVVSYDFENATPTSTSVAASTVEIGWTAAAVSRGSGLATPAGSDGSAPEGNPATGTAFSSARWSLSGSFNAASTMYLEFTVGTTGSPFDLEQISFDLRRSSLGPKDWDFRSSLDGYAVSLGSQNDMAALAFNSYSISLGSAFEDLNSPVTFRLYAFDADDLNHTLRIDNLNIEGALVPEPHQWAALAGLGLLGFAACRRARRGHGGAPGSKASSL